MRTILVGLISVVATTLSFAQGTVNFQNSTVLADPLHLTTPPDRLVRWGASAHFLNAAFTNTGPVYSNSTAASLSAQLYQGNSLAVEGTLTVVATAPVTFRSSTSAQVGVWRGITGVPLPDSGGATNAPGISGKLQVRVWDATYAPTYDAAVALGHAYPGLLGKSVLFNYTPPNTNSAPLPADFNMTNFTSFNVTCPCCEGPAVIATNITPSSISNVVGTIASFTIASCGAPTVSYQWYKSPGTALAGQTSPTLAFNYLQLADAGGYYCVVSNASGMATSSVGTVTVFGTPGVLAGLVLSNPKTKTDVTNATITVDGKVGAQPSGLAKILVNAGQGFTASTIVSNTATKITWTNSTVTLHTGTNLVFAQGIDNTATFGYSKTNLVFLKVPSTLTIITNGSGSVLGIPLKVPVGAIETPGVDLLDVERSYTLNIAPALNNLFSNVLQVINGSTSVLYTASPAKTAQKGDKKVGFTMKTNLTLIVNFVTNRFVGSAGVYYGLFMEATTAHESSGWFTVKTDSKLKFSGKLMQEGTPVTFSGTFDLAGVGTPKAGKIISRKLFLTDILTLGLQLNLASGYNISGTVASTNWGTAAVMDGDKLDPGSLPARATTNLALVMAGSLTPATQPAGDGYVLTTVDPVKGTIKSKGYAGDAYKIGKTIVTGLSTNGDWPFYAPLYQDTVDKTHNHGAIIGWLNISNGLVTGDLVWTKKSTAPGPAPYASGFTNMHSSGSTLLSSPVEVGISGNNLPGLTPLSTVTIQDGNLAGPIVTNCTYIGGKVVVLSNKFNGIKVTIKTSAEVNGQIDKLVPPTKFYGVALQNAGVTRGVFAGSTQSGSVRLTP